MLDEDGGILRIYIGETEKHGNMPMYEWLVREAKNQGLAGCSVFRGITGFGVHSKIHTAKLLDLSVSLPVVIEIIDTHEKIEAFVPLLDGVLKHGAVTVEKVHARFYRAAPAAP